MVTTNSAMLPLGTTAPDFSLIDTVTGKPVNVADTTGQPLLVAFICNHCPYVKFIQPVLATLTSRWLDVGVAVVGICSNDAQAHPDDGPQAMAREAATAGYRFPYLFDGDQAVAIAYRAACTPDFFLFRSITSIGLSWPILPSPAKRRTVGITHRQRPGRSGRWCAAWRPALSRPTALDRLQHQVVAGA